MKLFRSSIIISAVASVVAAGLACSSEDPAKPSKDPCGECATPAAIDLMTPAVTFRANVLPVLRKGCGNATCHGADPTVLNVMPDPADPKYTTGGGNYDEDLAYYSSATGKKARQLYPSDGLYLGCNPEEDNVVCTEPDDAAITRIVTYMTGSDPALTSQIAMLTEDTVQTMGKSRTDTAHKIVEPGNPDTSFLVAKIYGCQKQLSGGVCNLPTAALSDCANKNGGNCGDFMPSPDDPDITDADRDTIRRWIAQGALNN